MPVGITAAATVGAAAIGAGSSIIAANKAASAADRARDANIALAREFRADNHEMMDPFVDRGHISANALMALLGLGGDPSKAKEAFDTYRGSAGYNYVLDQGIEAVDQSAASRGNLHSGATMAAVQDRGRDTMQVFFDSYLNRLAGQQGVGLSAASSIAGNDTQILGGMMGANDSAASASGNAALASANSINNLISRLALSYGMYGQGGNPSAYRTSGAGLNAAGTTLFGQPTNYNYGLTG
jgi:hypothetical protein